MSNMVPLCTEPAELIVFLEVDSGEITSLTKDVEHIKNYPYLYEYHLTLGWFMDENPGQLRKWANQAVDFVKEQILRLEPNDLNDACGLFRIIIDRASRQPDARGGGFYFQPTAESAQQAFIIQKELMSHLSTNHIRSSVLILDYQPHIT